MQLNLLVSLHRDSGNFWIRLIPLTCAASQVDPLEVAGGRKKYLLHECLKGFCTMHYKDGDKARTVYRTSVFPGVKQEGDAWRKCGVFLVCKVQKLQGVI